MLVNAGPVCLPYYISAEMRLSMALRHITIEPFREEMLEIPGVQAWLGESSGYVIKKCKGDTRCVAHSMS